MHTTVHWHDSLGLTSEMVKADETIVAGNGATLLGVTGTLMALSLLAVILRCWARHVILRTFGWDDGAILLALVSHGVQFMAYLTRGHHSDLHGFAN